MTEKIDLSSLRGIPLEDIAMSFGGERDPKDPTRNWRIGGQRYSLTGAKFYNHDQEKGGGGAIDFTVHLLGYEIGDRNGFVKAISHLANTDFEAALNQYILEGRKHVENMSSEKVNVKSEIPPPNPNRLPRVINYLVQERGIPRDIVEKEIANGRLYADNFGNAVFKLTAPDLTGRQMGVELRGTIADKPFHGVRGEEKGFFFTGNAKGKIAVFVEAGIDGLSFIALNPGKMAVGTVGSRKETLQECAQNLMKQGFEIRAGFDLDQTGERLANTLKEVVGEHMKREVPDPAHMAKFEAKTGQAGKDWNDALRGYNAMRDLSIQDHER